MRGKEFALLAVIVGQNRGIVPSAVRTSLENNVQINATQRIYTIHWKRVHSDNNLLFIQ